MLTLLCIVALAVLLIILFFIYQCYHIVTTKIKLDFDVPHPLRIVHLTDLHEKQFGKQNRILLQRVEELHPDLVVFTGDLVYGHRQDVPKMIHTLSVLAARYPFYYVPGNHEHRMKDIGVLLKQLEQAGVHVLQNRIITTQIAGDTLSILGMDEDPEHHKDFSDPNGPCAQKRRALLSQLEGCDGLRLLLCHHPENYALLGEVSYNQFDFDLMLSGHTHGGQIALPKFGPIYAPGQGFFPKYVHGLYGENRPHLIISRGAGRGIVPIQMFSYPEIMCVEII